MLSFIIFHLLCIKLVIPEIEIFHLLADFTILHSSNCYLFHANGSSIPIRFRQLYCEVISFVQGLTVLVNDFYSAVRK